MTLCKSKTKSGKPCQNSAQDGSDYCHIESHKGEEKELTTKQARFVEEYTVDFNATQAAIRSGYSEKTAYNIGYENVRKREISDAIQERLKRYSMSAEEALKRMTDWGRADMSPFHVFDKKSGTIKIDLSTPQAQENLHLIKEMKLDEDGRVTEIKLHDAKDAVDKIIKVHGMYVDNINMKVQREEFDAENGDPEEYLAKRLGGK